MEEAFDELLSDESESATKKPINSKKTAVAKVFKWQLLKF